MVASPLSGRTRVSNASLPLRAPLGGTLVVALPRLNLVPHLVELDDPVQRLALPVAASGGGGRHVGIVLQSGMGREEDRLRFLQLGQALLGGQGGVLGLEDQRPS